ncbi:hypothetical protein F5884DRAFT_810084 [Xylogone sp. PMI_703]|nr:hypothetical protein F5884DRAFT_810084 [Xylogone sp. PMI_703]
MQSLSQPGKNRCPLKRTRTGCITCKNRHVKCDETKPSCQRCTSTKRKCEGYQAPKEPAPVAFLVVATCSARPDCNRKAQMAFQFFYEICAPNLLRSGNSSFLSKLILQACQVEKSIKHLVIAVSSLSLQQHGLSASSENIIFLVHYGEALKLLSNNQDPDITIMLIACLLLITCSQLQNKDDITTQHVLAGKRILDSYSGRKVSGYRNPVVEEVALIFSRLEIEGTKLLSK